ncbi:hypothetical protein EJB05_57198, partial [Eragrostis curvula]
MTGQFTDLPPATKLLRNKQESVEDRDLRGAGVTDDSTVVLRFESFALAVAKPSDKRWTHIQSRYRITSVLPYAGRIYCSTRMNIFGCSDNGEQRAAAGGVGIVGDLVCFSGLEANLAEAAADTMDATIGW